MRRFLANLRRLWIWLPLIWNDRNWDWAYLYRIWAFKLRQMQYAFETDGSHVGDDQNARQMQICAAILERLDEDRIDYIRKPDLEQQHLELFAKLFVRHSKHWWT